MRKQTKPIPRGIRNNNPLNIRIGNVWLGEVQNPTDTEFEQFVSMEYGLRAGFVLLRRYIRHYKLDTITAIISRWAPRSENDTSAYIRSVADTMGIPADEPLTYEDKATMCKLVDAMCLVECGQHILPSKIEQGYLLTWCLTQIRKSYENQLAENNHSDYTDNHISHCRWSRGSSYCNVVVVHRFVRFSLFLGQVDTCPFLMSRQTGYILDEFCRQIVIHTGGLDKNAAAHTKFLLIQISFSHLLYAREMSILKKPKKFMKCNTTYSKKNYLCNVVG